MNQTILVIVAHPDDEVLGCGGAIAKLSKEGNDIHIVFLADGVSSRLNSPAIQREELSIRHSAARKACAILGARSISFGEFPDNQMDTAPLLDVVKVVEGFIKKHNPSIIFTHHCGDVNIDHRIVHEAVVVACRPQQGSSVKTLLTFEVPSSTEWQLPNSAPPFLPNYFIDVSESFNQKLAALDAYAAELRPAPHPRSLQGVEYLSRWRGATVGVDVAEAFMLGRHIR